MNQVMFAKGTNREDCPVELIQFAQEVADRRNATWGNDHPCLFLVEIKKAQKYFKMHYREFWKETNKLNESCSVFAFIDFDGNIFKSASYKAPAKGIRGNIYQNTGKDSISIDGYIKYNR